MDRPVDFYRGRQMHHDRCGHTCVVDLEWYKRYQEGAHGCPGCSSEAGFGSSLQFTGDPADPVLDDQFATEITWFHTSTHQGWPAPIDFAGTLTDLTKQRMGEESAARWARRQSTKALHVGTYESAVHNMLRRMSDQSGKGEQFYLFGVRLRPDVAILPGSMHERSTFGDVWIDEIAPPGIEIVRYVNVYEDPGGLSLAIRPSAIATTRCLPIPLTGADDDRWVIDTAAGLRSVSTELTPLPEEFSEFPDLYRETHRAKAAREAAEGLSAGLPATMRHEFESAVRWEDGDDPAEWASHAKRLSGLVGDAERVRGELAAQPAHDL
jgi:hypothetical protein